MTTKFALIIILLISTPNISFGQQEYKPTDIIKVIRKDLNNHYGNSIWTTSNKDSLYFHSDTISLFSNSNDSILKYCCHYIKWNFKNKNTFTLSTLHSCIEPPEGMINTKNVGLKIKLKKTKNAAVLKIYRGTELIEKFEVLSINGNNKTNLENAYRITLRRIDINKSHNTGSRSMP